MYNNSIRTSTFYAEFAALRFLLLLQGSEFLENVTCDTASWMWNALQKDTVIDIVFWTWFVVENKHILSSLADIYRVACVGTSKFN